MKIACDHCQASFKVDESKIRKEGSKVRCAKCKKIFTIYPPPPPAPSAAAPPGKAAAQETPEAPPGPAKPPRPKAAAPAPAAEEKAVPPKAAPPPAPAPEPEPAPEKAPEPSPEPADAPSGAPAPEAGTPAEAEAPVTEAAPEPAAAAHSSPGAETQQIVDAVKKGKAGPAYPVFRIVGEKACPQYKAGDEFVLKNNSLVFPKDRSACLTLVNDVMKVIEKCKNFEDPDGECAPGEVFNCSGCSGVVRVEFKSHERPAGASAEDSNYVDVVTNLLRNFTIFESIEPQNVNKFCTLMKLAQYAKGDIIIRKGEPGRNLYIVVSGKVEVVGDDDMSIAFIGKGEVFGEMSILSGNPVGATIKVAEPTSVLYISNQDLRAFLNESPALQMYFTKLLARRMAEINLARSEEFASGMTGKLSEMPPSELFQTLNMNQKTGVLTLKSARTAAYLSFREGGLVGVKYDELEGKDAFYELLKWKDGRFKFLPGLSPEEMNAPEIGDFMGLLMEGLRKIDEADRTFLKTAIPKMGASGAG